jgi:Cu(I)/Ag(I) efflux system protein CusF
MKAIALMSFVILGASAAVMAQSSDMKGMDMKGMDGMRTNEKPMAMGDKGQTTHKATGVVKGADRNKGTVTLAHQPVPTLKWPAMTMSFVVKDKAMLDKLPANKKVEVEFVQQGKDYVITGVK